MSFVEFQGIAKLDRRTKHLVKRLGPDDIAIVDHRDLDRISAEELVESGVRVVFNVAESVTGRFPNPGPLTLVRGGVRLIDVPGAELFDAVREASRSSSAEPSSFGTARGSPRDVGSPSASSRRVWPSSAGGSPTRSRASPRTRCASSETRGACSPKA